MKQSFFKDKRVLVTGACGTVGSKIVHHLLKNYDVDELIGLDNNESELFFLEQKYSGHPNAHFFLADIRDAAKLEIKFQNIDIVFHLAAQALVRCGWAPGSMRCKRWIKYSTHSESYGLASDFILR